MKTKSQLTKLSLVQKSLPNYILKQLIFFAIMLLVLGINNAKSQTLLNRTILNNAIIEKYGLKFFVNGTYGLYKADNKAGGLFGAENYIFKVEAFSGYKQGYSGVDYKGKHYQETDFGGALTSYFDAIKIENATWNANVSGFKDCKTFYIQYGNAGSSHSIFCTPLPDAKFSIDQVQVTDITVTGVDELTNKIDELEQQKIAAAKAVEDAKAQAAKAQAAVQNDPRNAHQSTQSGTSTDGTNTANPKTAAANLKDKVNKLINEGNGLYAQGQYMAAIQKYDAALALDPNSSAAYNARNQAVNALKVQNQIAQVKANNEASKKVIDKGVETVSNIATDVLRTKGGRFGFFGVNLDADIAYGITFGGATTIHINMGATPDFNGFTISMDLLGIRLAGHNPKEKKDLFYGIFPSVGLNGQTAKEDPNTNNKVGNDYTSVQGGVVGLIDSGGFYLKLGYTDNITYIDKTTAPTSTGSLIFGIGFGHGW